MADDIRPARFVDGEEADAPCEPAPGILRAGSPTDPMVMPIDERQRPHAIGDRGETAVLCGSSEQLAEALGRGLDRWLRYTRFFA